MSRVICKIFINPIGLGAEQSEVPPPVLRQVPEALALLWGWGKAPGKGESPQSGSEDLVIH